MPSPFVQNWAFAAHKVDLVNGAKMEFLYEAMSLKNHTRYFPALGRENENVLLLSNYKPRHGSMHAQL